MLPQLETPRLLLRELSLDDAPALQAFQTRPSYLRCQAMEPAEFQDATERVQRYMQYRGEGEQRRLFDFVGRLRTDGEVIGHGCLWRSSPGIASLGLGIDERYAGRGLATEIALRLLAFGFGELKLHRIEADVAVENAACIRVLEKIGMFREGVAHDCIFAQGRWWTEAKYAMLARDHAGFVFTARRNQNIPAAPIRSCRRLHS
jgi:[ribosomal protein S5]-alanine N-acetyltransferase